MNIRWWGEVSASGYTCQYVRAEVENSEDLHKSGQNIENIELQDLREKYHVPKIGVKGVI